MTAAEFLAAKTALGCTWRRLAEALGYEPNAGCKLLSAMGAGTRAVPKHVSQRVQMILASEEARKVVGL